jgi:hypothetical protein
MYFAIGLIGTLAPCGGLGDASPLALAPILYHIACRLSIVKSIFFQIFLFCHIAQKTGRAFVHYVQNRAGLALSYFLRNMGVGFGFLGKNYEPKGRAWSFLPTKSIFQTHEVNFSTQKFDKK